MKIKELMSIIVKLMQKKKKGLRPHTNSLKNKIQRYAASMTQTQSTKTTLQTNNEMNTNTENSKTETFSKQEKQNIQL